MSDAVVGVVAAFVPLAALWLMRRRRPAEAKSAEQEAVEVAAVAAAARILPPGVDVFDVGEPWALYALGAVVDGVGEVPRAIIVRFGRMRAIDAGGAQVLADLLLRCRRQRTLVILSEMPVAVRLSIEERTVGRGALVADSLDVAIARAWMYLGGAMHGGVNRQCPMSNCVPSPK
jgi:MFS superfamily sulfate permease-like transporter